MSVTAITSVPQYKEITGGVTPVAVFFSSEKVQSCKPIAQLLEEKTKGLSSQFYKVDIDAQDKVAKEAGIGIRDVPTIVIYRYNQKLGECTGTDPQNVDRAITSVTSS
ncbi:hypothetical protein BDV27DRAFT_137803 [Aspergillus caelatus]|uniref:Thioredoxin domain-containing protein n=2 Tax=Aspergillus subgen. Circumdati TaxID=2720871 RepID=A0A5N6ZNG6_9EURO|nr:uncharacterized protein BDV27DRAFT_137803 [Aspergillus caelatus]KAE8358389.1 hypothetical protein BDV27DRAFT_137803 [Aspergillus caelatus]KAE8416569.1 hypothetical protein BDV36DRAFT_202892 [Aspergillus pseudocaelatus]